MRLRKREVSGETRVKLSKSAVDRKKKKLAKGLEKHEPKPVKKDFNKTIKQFVNMHFQGDGVHNGTIILQTKCVERLEGGTTPTGAPLMKYVGFAKPEELYKFLSERHYAKDNAYYITANSFTKGRRRKDEAFTLYNIVIDIDCHHAHGMSQGELDHLLRSFVYALTEDFKFDFGLDAPNTVVYTGRGLQLWYALEPASARCAKMYEYVARDLKERLTTAISANMGRFSLVSVDGGMSGSIAGLYRLPMTLNQKTGTYGKIEFIHDRRTDLAATQAEAYEARQERIPAFIYRSRTGDPKETADHRAAAIFELVRMRNAAGINSKGYRDNALFCLYNSMIHAYEDNVVMVKLRELNTLFTIPLPEHEYISYMSTSRNRAAAGKPYLLRNVEIIGRLNIAPEEQKHIRLFPAAQQSSEKRREEARERKAERDKKILELAKEVKTKREIAKRVGCSESTVANVLQRNGKKSGAERERRSICYALIKGETPKTVAKKFGRSLKNVLELAQKIVQRGYDTLVGKKHIAPDGGKKIEKKGCKERHRQGEQAAPVSVYEEESWEQLLLRYNQDDYLQGGRGNAYFWRAAKPPEKAGGTVGNAGTGRTAAKKIANIETNVAFC